MCEREGDGEIEGEEEREREREREGGTESQGQAEGFMGEGNRGGGARAQVLIIKREVVEFAPE